MKYKISKQQLGNDLLFDTLAALQKSMAAHGCPLFVVGAQARDIAMKILGVDESKRRTCDLDVAVGVQNWMLFDGICKTLENNNFKRIGNTQKFVYRNNDYEVDIVPFGGVEENEQICWPPDGNPVMSVKGFQNIMQASNTVVIENNVEIRIPTLCGLFFLKLDAWKDRHDSTNKDAIDMIYILKNYFDIQIQSDITPPNVIDFYQEDSDSIIWGIQWLAYDAGQILTAEHRKYFSDFVSNELRKKYKSKLIIQLMQNFEKSQSENSSIYYEIVCKILKNLVEVLA